MSETTRNGERCDSLSGLIKLKEEYLQSKVFIRYLSYDGKQYISPPLSCFKCQTFGHIAAICKGKYECGRCAGLI